MDGTKRAGPGYSAGVYEVGGRAVFLLTTNVSGAIDDLTGNTPAFQRPLEV
jgi:hypothetical protein